MTTDMVLVDVYGKEFKFSITNLRWMIVTGWIFYLLSLISTYIYYKIHPSYCNLSWKAIKNRLTIKENKETRLELSDGLGSEEGGNTTPTSHPWTDLNWNNTQTQSETEQENMKDSGLQPLHLQQQSSSLTSPKNLSSQNEDETGKIISLAIYYFLCFTDTTKDKITTIRKRLSEFDNIETPKKPNIDNCGKI